VHGLGWVMTAGSEGGARLSVADTRQVHGQAYVRELMAHSGVCVCGNHWACVVVLGKACDRHGPTRGVVC
jgi:hypothetical protein